MRTISSRRTGRGLLEPVVAGRPGTSLAALARRRRTAPQPSIRACGRRRAARRRGYSERGRRGDARQGLAAVWAAGIRRLSSRTPPIARRRVDAVVALAGRVALHEVRVERVHRRRGLVRKKCMTRWKRFSLSSGLSGKYGRVSSSCHACVGADPALGAVVDCAAGGVGEEGRHLHEVIERVRKDPPRDRAADRVEPQADQVERREGPQGYPKETALRLPQRHPSRDQRIIVHDGAGSAPRGATLRERGRRPRRPRAVARARARAGADGGRAVRSARRSSWRAGASSRPCRAKGARATRRARRPDAHWRCATCWRTPRWRSRRRASRSRLRAGQARSSSARSSSCATARRRPIPTRRLRPIAIDATTAGLLDARFDVVGDEAHLALRRERTTADPEAPRTLLGASDAVRRPRAGADDAGGGLPRVRRRGRRARGARHGRLGRRQVAAAARDRCSRVRERDERRRGVDRARATR